MLPFVRLQAVTGSTPLSVSVPRMHALCAHHALSHHHQRHQQSRSSTHCIKPCRFIAPSVMLVITVCVTRKLIQPMAG
jgi:hypothetical protein